MAVSQPSTSNRGALFAVVALILGSAVIQAAVGFNTVFFPVRLESYGLSKGLIGLCLAFEMGAVLAVVGSIDKILTRLGLLGTMAFAWRCCCCCPQVRVCRSGAWVSSALGSGPISA